MLWRALVMAMGGLALFLYGMQLMEEGLSGGVGERIRHLLEGITNSSLKAVLAGAGATAMVQSSSVTTVMVVRFVDAGILSLQQAAGMILGANIGTTITAWIFWSVGSNGISMSCIASCFAVIGAGLSLAAKQKYQSAADSFIGLAVLIFGMEFMSGAMIPLAKAPFFTNMGLSGSDPVSGILAGMTLTALIQSSSASVGILQAWCNIEPLPFRVVIPIVMGQNIGTCVTALLSCATAGKNAKCAAFIHLFFNVIAAGVFLVLFWGINTWVPLPWLEMGTDGFGIACIHSSFNIGAAFLLYPFLRRLVGVACRTVGLITARPFRRPPKRGVPPAGSAAP